MESPESPQGRANQAAGTSRNASISSAMLHDRQRMCESPRPSMSEIGHSEHATLAEKDEAVDIVGEEPAKTSPHRIQLARHQKRRHQRQDSWMSNNFSPTGTVYELNSSRNPVHFDMDMDIPFTQSPTDERFPAPIKNIAKPAHLTHPPRKEIKSCFPTTRNRYDRGIFVPRNRQSWKFGPLETFSVHDIYCDRNWSPNTHPEGQLYFASCRNEGSHLFLTEEHLYDQKNVDEIELFVAVFEEKFRSKARDHRELLNMEMDIFLSLNDYDGEGWYYYCVDTARRCLFWLDEVDLTWMADTVGSVPTKQHLKYGLDYEYWIHVEHFPFHQEIPDSLIHDLMGVAIHSSVDAMTSLDSTVPFSKEETRELVGLIKHLHTLKKTEYSRGYIVVAAARLMTVFVNERFFHFAGQHGARLTKDQSIRGSESKRTRLIRLLSPVLFFAPETHLASLEKIYVDELIKAHPWKLFVTKLEEDWIQYVLYATVLLTADVSFLAVPNVMPNNGIPQGQSAPPAVVATQISLIAAMGSIMIGLLLVREHRKKASDSAQVAADFLHRRSHRSRGLEAMAILYSLPFALLMWGMVSFLAALGIICFVFTVNGLVPTILYAIVWGFVSLLILFTIVAQLEARFGVSWQRFAIIKYLPWRRRERGEKDEEKEAEMESDKLSVSATVDSVRSRRMRINLDFFMRRKKDSRRDTVFDLER